MRKLKKWVLAATRPLALTVALCGVSVFTSCSSNDDNPAPQPSLNVAEKIVGKWMVAELDGKPCPTNLKTVVSFVSPTKAYGSISDIYSMTWNVKVATDVIINGNRVTMFAEEDEHTTHELGVTITSITDKDMLLSSDWKVYVDGQSIHQEIYGQERWVRVTSNYKDAIIGTWEGRSTSAENTEFDDGENHRWEYMADGTFHYYVKVDGQWQMSNDDFSEYFVDGNLLCTRWKNTGIDNDEHREWWEIASIKDGVMKWTALRMREDGSTYTATFEMAKVN